MADSKISALTAKTTVADTDMFVIAESGGTNKKVTGATMRSEVGGLFDAYAQVSHTLAAGTNGGDSSAGGIFRTYPINTEDFDPAGLLLVAANQITLNAGTYYVEGWLTVHEPNARYMAKLLNVTDTVNLLTGRSGYKGGGTPNLNLRAELRGRITLSAQKVLELQYRVQAGVAGEGLGTSVSFSVPEKYAELTFWREA